VDGVVAAAVEGAGRAVGRLRSGFMSFAILSTRRLTSMCSLLIPEKMENKQKSGIVRKVKGWKDEVNRRGVK
jgi:hypothetical protein